MKLRYEVSIGRKKKRRKKDGEPLKNARNNECVGCVQRQRERERVRERENYKGTERREALTNEGPP